MDVLATSSGMALRFNSVEEIEELQDKLDWLIEETHNKYVNVDDESDVCYDPKTNPPFVLGLFDNITQDKAMQIMQTAKSGLATL